MQKSRFYKYILYFIIIFPLVIPEGIATLASNAYSLIFKYGRIMSFLIILTLYLYKLKNGNRSISIQLRYMFILAIYCLFVSLLTGHGSSGWLNAFWPCLFAGIVVEYSINDTDILINSLLIVLELWIYINLIYVILYPNGMYVNITIGYTRNWILGYKSSFQYLIFPAVILGWIKSAYNGSKVRFWLLFVASITESYLSKNVMLVIALVIVSICYVFKVIDFTRIFNSFTYSIGILIINIIFLFSLTVLVNTKIGTLFLDFSDKSKTLSGRASYIWPITIQKIIQNPIFGYGVWSSNDRRALYLNRLAAIHAHNQLLEMLFVGGIIFLAIYTLFFIRMRKVTSESTERPATKILMFGLFVFFCMMSVEIFMRHTGFPIWVLIFLAFISNKIDLKYSHKSLKMKKGHLRMRLKLKP